MGQMSLSDYEYSNRKKKTKREEFLEIKDEIIPWDEWVGVILHFYYKGQRGCPPKGVEVMLRMYLLWCWFYLSDEGVEDAIYDSYAFRKFMGINFLEQGVPDATTLLHFRHLLEENGLNKLFTEVIRQNDVICIEDLAPKNVVQNYKLAKSISDASWGEFRRQLVYKAAWYGKRIVAIDRFYPSSQLCSRCSIQWRGTKDLSVRKWTCPVCGTVHDRDMNAAKNILNEGLCLLA